MCVRCGTGTIAWCTDTYRHGESATPLQPGDPVAVPTTTANSGLRSSALFDEFDDLVQDLAEAYEELDDAARAEYIAKLRGSVAPEAEDTSPGLPERQYKVVVYEVTDTKSLCSLPNCPLDHKRWSEIVHRDISASTPWDAVRNWAGEMTDYESQ